MTSTSPPSRTPHRDRYCQNTDAGVIYAAAAAPSFRTNLAANLFGEAAARIKDNSRTPTRDIREISVCGQATPVHTSHAAYSTGTQSLGAAPFQTPTGPASTPPPPPPHPEALAKNKLIMPQRVFRSTQCIPLIPGSSGEKILIDMDRIGKSF